MSSSSKLPPSTYDNQCEFIGLLTQYQVSLRAYIISLMPGVNGVSDVLQDTNLTLWEKSKTFKPGSNFKAWAFAIARHKAKNHLRKVLRQQPVLCLDDDLTEKLASHCLLEPEDTEMRMSALEKCLSKLNPGELALIKQRYATETTLEEYARTLSRPAGSLRVTIYRIRRNLRQCISYQLKLTS